MNPIGPVNALLSHAHYIGGRNRERPAQFSGGGPCKDTEPRDPQHLSIGLGKAHYSNGGIHENRAFSICLPSEDLMVETDCCGIMTGRKTDKAVLLDVFHGELKTAPMIRQCPVNMELKLHDVLDSPTHDIFVGELVQTYADDEAMTNGKIDISKVRPLLFDMVSVRYWRLGPVVGKCWNAGKSPKR